MLEDGQEIEVARFDLYPDGFVADTRCSTSASDRFIADAVHALSGMTGAELRRLPVRARNYVSELVVATEFDLESVDQRFRRFSEVLSGKEGGPAFQPVSLRFGTDPANPGSRLEFIFERRSDAPFSEKRYFSHAPVTTERHIELLGEFERIMSPTRRRS